MTAEFISVGTEILLGNIINTNANYLSRKCAELGISNYFQISVGDNEERLAQTLETALSRSDIVILTGGLGPTKDDLTKEVTAKTLHRELVEHEGTKKFIKNYFARINKNNITENNWKQALIIEGSTVVENHNGTAPGLIVKTEEGKIVILLPGPPNELVPMFERDIYPFLNELQPGVLYSEMVKICGIGESQAETMIQDLIEKQTNPTIAPYAKTGEVHLRVTASTTTTVEGENMVKPIVSELYKRFGNHIYTTDETENLEDTVVKLMQKHNLVLSTAESCTGGLLTGKIVNVSGASSVLGEGFITYSNEAKQKYLGVKQKTLEHYGAVSEETALEMANGLIKTTGSDVSVAITGIAGPDGGTEEKPAGTVYVSCSVNNNTRVKKYNFSGNRQKIRDYAVINALNFLRTSILEEFNS